MDPEKNLGTETEAKEGEPQALPVARIESLEPQGKGVLIFLVGMLIGIFASVVVAHRGAVIGWIEDLTGDDDPLIVVGEPFEVDMDALYDDIVVFDVRPDKRSWTTVRIKGTNTLTPRAFREDDVLLEVTSESCDEYGKHCRKGLLFFEKRMTVETWRKHMLEVRSMEEERLRREREEEDFVRKVLQNDE